MSLVGILLLGVNLLKAQQAPFDSCRKVLHITRVNHGPKIDGRLDDPIWREITPISDFVQYEPDNGAAPSETTYVYVAYDEDYLYLAFDCRDSEPDKIMADIAPRGEVRSNDRVGVILDTYNDRRTAYRFWVNPYGIQGYSTDTIWRSAGRITEQGWTAEMAIPFKSLRFPRRREQIWGINFFRKIQRKDEYIYWTHVGRDDNLLEKSGLLKGLHDIRWGHNLEFFPYLGARDSREIGGLSERKSAAGLDIKYGIASNLTLDVSISPDFSEVESDPYFFQLTPYEYYLRERRPFFEEAWSYFYTPIRLFYSRRIKNPKLALKLTGKTGAYSIGVIAAADNIRMGPDEYYGILRLKRDILRTSSIGLLLTDKEWQTGFVRNASLDWKLRFGGVHYVRGQIAGSFTPHTPPHNIAAHFSASRWVDHGINAGLYFRDIGENFETKTGFVPRRDIQSGDCYLGYAWRLNRKGIRRLQVRVSLSESRNHAGLTTWKGFSLDGNIRFMNNMFLFTSYSQGRGRSQILQQGELVWDKTALPSKYLFLYFGSFRGGFIDWSLNIGEGLETSIYQDNFTRVVSGRSRSYNICLTLRPRKNIQMETEANYYVQFLKQGDQKAFEAWTLSSSLRYQFTKDWFARLYWRAETKEHRYRTDLMIGYYFKAGSIFYLTYKEERERSRNYGRSYYTLMAKFSYLWRI